MEMEKELKERDAKFAQEFSMWINNYSADWKGVARSMARDHRTLVQYSFDFVMEFMRQLAEDYDNKRFDGRDERACWNAKQIVENQKNLSFYPTCD